MRDWLQGVKDEYDIVVIGSGLAGLTAANTLAKIGHSVLLLEQHANYGGMATWFTRSGGHLFDISLHGFPIGMIKSCRKYWTQEIADSIVQLKHIRFDNPQFSIEPSRFCRGVEIHCPNWTQKIWKQPLKRGDFCVQNFQLHIGFAPIKNIFPAAFETFRQRKFARRSDRLAFDKKFKTMERDVVAHQIKISGNILKSRNGLAGFLRFQ